MAMEAGSHMSVQELQLLEARQKDGKTPKEMPLKANQGGSSLQASVGSDPYDEYMTSIRTIYNKICKPM